MMRRLTLAGPPAQRGRTHGEAFAGEIRSYAADRAGLAGSGLWSSEPASQEQLFELATEMLPAHERYSPELYMEMTALAEAAGITLAEAVIVGGFTDFVDTLRGRLGGAAQEDDCTAVIVPGPAAVDGMGMLGQTWDMHDTATKHIVMLELTHTADPAALVFTTVGCLGQIGMNEAGICVGINNLTATAGTVGVTWPFVVRQVLRATDLDDAVKAVLDAPLAGAHNFLLLDRTGRGVNIEAMPQAAAVTEVTAEPFVHTNHVLDQQVASYEAPRPHGLLASSRARHERASAMLDGRPVTPERLMAITRDPDAVCQVSAPPYHIESCGAAIMRPATGEFWAVSGRPDLNEYELLRLA